MSYIASIIFDFCIYMSKNKNKKGKRREKLIYGKYKLGTLFCYQSDSIIGSEGSIQ